MPKRTKPRRKKSRKVGIPKKVTRENPKLIFNISPQSLALDGPIIHTNIHISGPQQEYLNNNKIPIPPEIRCRFLIDTGADFTVVKNSIAAQAQLAVIKTNFLLQGIGQNQSGKLFLGRIIFRSPSTKYTNLVHSSWVDTSIAAGDFPHWNKFEGIIGRDVLQHFRFSYSGRSGEFTLQYLKRG